MLDRRIQKVAVSLVISSLLVFAGSCGQPQVSSLFDGEGAYNGSVYQDVWQQITSDRYESLPKHTVSMFNFGSFFFNKLRASAKRTVSDRSDLLPRFKKLVHPNGICLTGRWRIDRDSRYTGYFANGSSAMIIARASVALSNTKRGGFRAFGLAGKLYPTSDAGDTRMLRTANFFTIDDLGGTKIGDFTETTLLNAPNLTLAGRGVTTKAIGAAIGAVFAATDSDANVRQVYEVSHLGLDRGAVAITPRYMKLKGSSSNSMRIRYPDFRDDLRVENFGGSIDFDISVSTKKDSGWETIGKITFTEDAASESCDHRLHFHHPKTQQLNHGD